MIKIWGRRNSFNVQKVMWALGELGLDHEHIDAGGPFGVVDAPEYLAMNPNGLVPTLEDKGVAIWESHTILRYLAAEYGKGSLWPEDALARTQTDRWIDWTQSALGQSFMHLFWLSYRTPVDQQRYSAIANAIQRNRTEFQMLDQHLETQDFIAGDQLTMGDIPAGCTLYRYFNLDTPRTKLPNVEAWYARLQERPAYKEHVMVPFDDLKGRLAF